MARPRSAALIRRRLCVLVAGGALLAACAPEPSAPRPLRSAVRLTALRHQAPGDPSTVAVPTAVRAGERRPVLSGGPPLDLFTTSLPVGARRLAVRVPIPEDLRGRPLHVTVFVPWSGRLLDLKPRVVRSAGAEETVRLTFAEPNRGQPRAVTVIVRPAPDPEEIVGPVAVPPDAVLRFGVGVDTEDWPDDPPPVDFRLDVLAGADEQTAFRARLDPGRRAADRGWQDHVVDLRLWAGREVAFRLAAAPGARRARRLVDALWSEPRIMTPAATRPWNLLLVSLDTLRADHLGCYGYGRPTSPLLDRFAAEGMLFERAYASFPSTSGSHMTMLTGLYPCAHGVQLVGLSQDDRLRPDAHTLAELLRAAGYATAAYTEDAWVTAASGFARGFDVFVENKSVLLNQPGGQADTTFRESLDWIRAHTDEPWFLFAHTYQVHAPYTPPPGYLDRVLEGEQDLRAVIGPALYDAEIRYTDDLLGGFLEGLDALGLLDRTLVVITSDHGEQFGEHNLWLHANSLYDALLHVPLVMRAPGLLPAGVRIADDVGLVDLVPTLLDLLGLPQPRWCQGRDLARVLTAGGRPSYTRLFAAAPNLGLVAGRTRSVKWIVDARRQRVHAFNRRDDPNETRDIAGILGPDPGRALAREYERLCRAVPPAPPLPAPSVGMDPAVREKLRALGYVD